jgi:hypothetical protein
MNRSSSPFRALEATKRLRQLYFGQLDHLPAGHLVGVRRMLAAGASCALPVEFIPATGGSIAGSVVLTDNNLNQSGAMQSIGLSGTGTQEPQTITFTSPGTGSRAQGGTVMVSASGGGSGNPVTFTSLTPSVCTNPNSQGISSLIAPGTCTFAANQAGNMDYSAAPQVTQSFTVTPVFVLTVNPSITAKMPPGTAPVVLTLTPVNGFTGSVTLNCVLPTGVAKGTKCPGLPVTVKLMGGAAAVHDTGVQFPNGTNPATYVVTFTATDGKFNDSTTATFSVR